MSRNRTPTPAREGDTLDSIATFNLSRDLYETERKEIYTGVRDRLAELKKARKKTAELLGIPVEQEKEVSRVIGLYEGPDGILALFQSDAEALEESAKGGKDQRQLDITFDDDDEDADSGGLADTESEQNAEWGQEPLRTSGDPVETIRAE